MAKFTLAEVQEATRARLVGGGGDGVEFCTVSTDSRDIEPGALFVALQGGRYNGEDYAKRAVQAGAGGVLVRDCCRKSALDGVNVPVLCVPDTLAAYQALAFAWRQRFDVPLIAVTGSVGKTSTKDLIAAVMSSVGPVCKTEKNYNNEIGLAKTLLSIEPEHRAVVVEMGMRGLGQITQLANIARPTTAVITNVGDMHVELLGTVDNIAKAKAELVRAIPAGGTVILNADDERVLPMRDLVGDDVFALTFGLGEGADVRGEIIGTNPVTFKVPLFKALSADDQIAPTFETTLTGKHNVYNALAALAVGLSQARTPDEMQDSLAHAAITEGRFQVIDWHGYTFVNDAYNAGPASMAAALTSLREMTNGRKIAVLGDMLELGERAVEAHQFVGELASEAGLEVLITVGELARRIAEGAIGVHVIYRCKTHNEAAKVLRDVLKEGDTVLFKGSHAMNIDRVINLVMGETKSSAEKK